MSREEPLYRVLGLLEGVKKSGSGFKARCPGPLHKHADKDPSLSVSTGYDGRVLLKCFVGCTAEDILSALGLSYGDLFERSATGLPIRRFRAMDSNGSVVAEHVREDQPDGDKHMWWEKNGKKSLDGTPLNTLPLYRVPEVYLSDPSVPVVVCEGEKAAEALAELGVLAVSPMTGSQGNPSDDVLEPLQGREVWLWPDNDDPGRKFMAGIAQRIYPTPKWIVWPEAPLKGDGADYVTAGGTCEGIHALVESCPVVSSIEDSPREEEIEAFPLETLPRVLWRYVEESSRALVAPPDLVAVPLLTLAGAVIGNARQVEVKRGWREGPNLYSAVITAPGGKKTPSGAAAKRPIYRVQDRLKREHDDAMLRYREEMAEWEALSKVGRAGQHPPEPPKFGHVVTTDATTEAIASMLQHCKGLVLERDELAGWTRSMDQYRGGKGADRQHFLSMWSRGALKVDRKGAPPIFVPHPCLSVTGGIQPDMLSELIDSSGREDGFIDRILLSYPEEVADHWTEDEVSFESLTEVEALFETLFSLPNETGGEGGTVLLSQEAKALWREWYEANADEQQAWDFPSHLRGVWAKMPSQLLRIALILHVTTYPDALLMPPDILAAAIKLVSYFKSHAQRVYDCLGTVRHDKGTRILGAAKANGGRVSMWDLMDNVFQRNEKSADIRAELNRLVERGLMKPEKVAETGGRPREDWVLV
ncbi:MAG: DUF3987 domain-containing protein [Actinobacteria bacterium]|nr:DUF3987 domain-containing protein [Actinomycetota bacterium]